MSENIEIISCEEMPDGIWKINLKNNYKGRPYFYHKGKLEFIGSATIIEENKRWDGWKDLSDEMKKVTKPWIHTTRVVQKKDKDSKLYDDVEIVVCTKDDIGEDHDNKYCAIVMGYHSKSKGWVNTGIVVREYLPLNAFSKAMEIAIKEGLWK